MKGTSYIPMPTQKIYAVIWQLTWLYFLSYFCWGTLRPITSSCYTCIQSVVLVGVIRGTYQKWAVAQKMCFLSDSFFKPNQFVCVGGGGGGRRRGGGRGGWRGRELWSPCLWTGAFLTSLVEAVCEAALEAVLEVCFTVDQLSYANNVWINSLASNNTALTC